MSIQSFLNGVVVGVVLGLVFAPERGEVTRKRIAQRVSDLSETIEDTYDELSEKFSQQADRIEGMAREIAGTPSYTADTHLKFGN